MNWLQFPTVADESPNFVFVLTDDQGWTSLSTSMDGSSDRSSDYFETPNIKRLASEGMRFSQGYSPAPLCCPTRRSLQFGQSPLRQGDDEAFARRYPTDTTRPTIPRLLKSVNPRYAAAHYGKWDMRTDLAPRHLGYDEGDGPTTNGEGSLGDNGAADSISKSDKWKKSMVLKDPKRIFGIAERAGDFMTRMTAEKRPFFVQLSHYAVHVDMQSRKDTLAKYKRKPTGKVHKTPAFAAMLEDLDAGVGIVLDKIESLGIADNTYVFFMSDNGGVPWFPPDKVKHLTNPTTFDGPGHNSPLRAGKWTAFEGGIRVPFMVRGPQVKAGQFCDVPVIGWDILPTIADLAGFTGQLPDDLDGGSFRSLLTTGSGIVNRPTEFLIFHRFSNSYRHTAIRMGDYKLIRFWKSSVGFPIEESHLYDLKNDPGETQNLTAVLPVKRQELQQKMNDYLERVKLDVRSDLSATN